MNSYLNPKPDDVINPLKGEVIFHEGDPVQFLYIVKQGSVRIVKETGGRIIPLNVAYEQEFVGEESIFNREAYSSTAIALENCELVRVKKADILNVIFNCPEWINNLIKNIADRLNYAEEIIKEYKIVDNRLSEGKDIDPQDEVKMQKSIADYAKKKK